VALVVLLAGPILVGTPPLALAAPGGVGPVVDDAGMVYTSLRPSSADFGTALALEPDGKVVVAAGAGGDFGLARLSANLDEIGVGFTGRRVTTDFAGTDDVPQAVAVRGSGGFVACAAYPQHGADSGAPRRTTVIPQRWSQWGTSTRGTPQR
jgi:hypothetical protein